MGKNKPERNHNLCHYGGITLTEVIPNILPEIFRTVLEDWAISESNVKVQNEGKSLFI